MNKLDEMISGLPEAAKEYINGKKLDEVECVIADLPGIARGKAVPATKFSRQKSFHLPDSIFFQTITGGWGEAAGEEGFVERDMILKPDISTASAAPWTGDWTLQVIHDAFDRKKSQYHSLLEMFLNELLNFIMQKDGTQLLHPKWNFFLSHVI